MVASDRNGFDTERDIGRRKSSRYARPRSPPVFRFLWICALSRPPDETAGRTVLLALLVSIYSLSATALLCSVSCELYRRVTVPFRAARRIGSQASGARPSSAKYLRWNSFHL